MLMLIMSCYTGFFNVRRGWQSLNTGPRFYLRLIRRTGWLFIRRTGWLWIYTSRTTDGRPFKPKKLSVPFQYPGVPAGFSHFHINILVFFVGLSLIVLCYLCDFFSWLCHVLLHVFTIMIILFKHHRFTFWKGSFLYSQRNRFPNRFYSQRNRFQNRFYIRLIGKEAFLWFL
jgi:uncharacterized membrane protein YphA (DoxX/SURF4 family)